MSLLRTQHMTSQDIGLSSTNTNILVQLTPISIAVVMVHVPLSNAAMPWKTRNCKIDLWNLNNNLQNCRAMSCKAPHGNI